MAFDGLTVAAVTDELNRNVTGGRISKIAQPESDELIITVKNNGNQYRIFMSADASLPLVYLTDSNKQGPLTAPGFCMLLRKYLNNAKIVSIEQPGFERIIRFNLEHLNELGDMCRKVLVVEIMGKHSNIILLDDKEMIIDSIKHISAMVSSVREVLPGKQYFVPTGEGKSNPLLADREDFLTINKAQESEGNPGANDIVLNKSGSNLNTSGGTFTISEENLNTSGGTFTISECNLNTSDNNLKDNSDNITVKDEPSRGAAPLYTAIYKCYTGLSPLIANAICAKAGVDNNKPVQTLTKDEMDGVWMAFSKIMLAAKKQEYTPEIYYEAGMPREFAVVHIDGYEEIKRYDSISKLLQEYYAEKNLVVRIRQRSTDLRKIITNAIERDAKKYDLQLKQLEDTKKKDKYKLYGELLNAYGYSIEAGVKSTKVLNYYDNTEIEIPLDETKSAIDNAKKYYDKYNKLKRTGEALSKFVVETKQELDHLESILNSLDIARKEEDLVPIKEEMIESGFIKRKGGNKKVKITSKPLHYISSDGFHMYVGKNNYQNEELSFKIANGGDWWFHAKHAPGSHVIVKTEGQELPDRTFEEAAALAAHYSKLAGQTKPEIDYTQRKNLKKPTGGAPGFVVYYTNYSMIAGTDISGIEQVEKG